MWTVWRSRFGWSNLCPVLAADPWGLAVLMPRAQQPVTDEEVEAAIEDTYPGVNSECKVEDHGRVAGCVVILDYDLPDEDMVQERRRYYKGFGHDA